MTLVVGELAAAVEAGLDHGQDAVGEQGELAGSSKWTGVRVSFATGAGARTTGAGSGAAGSAGSGGGGSRRPSPRRRAGGASPRSWTARPRSRGAGVLVHAHPGALEPAGIGVGEHHHVDRLAGHVRDHRAVLADQELALGVHTWGRPKSKASTQASQGTAACSASARVGQLENPMAAIGSRSASGPRTRRPAPAGLGADLDHVDLLAGGDGGQGVGAGLAVGAVGRPNHDQGTTAGPRACSQAWKLSA